MSELYLRDRQRSQRIDLPRLETVGKALLTQISSGEYQLGVVLVSSREMARLNQEYLNHTGTTDVITFCYGAQPAGALHGEIFICVDVAIEQASRFRTTWQEELVRYLVHGVLHCLGYDDTSPKKRAAMKKVENRLLRTLKFQFSFSALHKSRRPRPRFRADP